MTGRNRQTPEMKVYMYLQLGCCACVKCVMCEEDYNTLLQVAYVISQLGGTQVSKTKLHFVLISKPLFH